MKTEIKHCTCILIIIKGIVVIFLSPHIIVSKNKTERTYLNDT